MKIKKMKKMIKNNRQQPKKISENEQIEKNDQKQ